MEEFLIKDNKKLRYGYTTGSCAAAAAKAAALMLFMGKEVHEVRLLTPKGMELLLEIEDIRMGLPEKVSCAVRKDSGDDPDVTNGTLVYAEVSRSDIAGVMIDGGEGVGRVTKPGLDQPVGNAAINSTPRKMIADAVREAWEKSNGAELKGGVRVIISIPAGRELAEKTFNPKLGIVGGISVLGTTGIIEPMSDEALLETIQVEINVRKAEKLPLLPVAPGNYGKTFFQEEYGFGLETAVTCSNFMRKTVDMAVKAGFTKMLFVGHIGKLVKVAGGIPNTHSKYGDHRMEITNDIAQKFCDPSEKATLEKELTDCVSMDEAVRILKEHKIDGPTLRELTLRVKRQMEEWARLAKAGNNSYNTADEQVMQVETVVFSNVYGTLGITEQALSFMEELSRASL